MDIISTILAVLPIFNVIPIGFALCTAPSGEVGNCLPNKDCIIRGGIPAGPCGGGYGLCCVCKFKYIWSFINALFIKTITTVLQTCGGVIRENSTYFVNPNHPDTYDGTGSCQVTVQKIHPDICQLRWECTRNNSIVQISTKINSFRLDLDMFSIAPPEPVNHLCTQDQLLVSGSSPVPTICGTSTGDHSKLICF